MGLSQPAKVRGLPATSALRDRWRSLTERLVLLKDEAGRLGLFRTMHALDHATRAVGWERAELGQGVDALQDASPTVQAARKRRPDGAGPSMRQWLRGGTVPAPLIRRPARGRSRSSRRRR